MNFSELVKVLENGDSGVIEFSLSNNPEINKASSIEKARINEISFLESGSYLLQELNNTNASALILPNEKEL